MPIFRYRARFEPTFEFGEAVPMIEGEVFGVDREFSMIIAYPAVAPSLMECRKRELSGYKQGCTIEFRRRFILLRYEFRQRPSDYFLSRRGFGKQSLTTPNTLAQGCSL